MCFLRLLEIEIASLMVNNASVRACIYLQLKPHASLLISCGKTKAKKLAVINKRVFSDRNVDHLSNCTDPTLSWYKKYIPYERRRRRND